MTEYLQRLSKRVTEYLGSGVLEKFQALTDPESDKFLLNDSDLSATCIDQLAWGRRPG